MRQTIRLLALLAFGICQPAEAGPKHVAEVVDIACSLEKSNPPNLVVAVQGTVNTTGWSAPQLTRRVYVKPPADGIWEYDFTAVPPSGMSGQAQTTVRASNRWEHFPWRTVRGVRVYGIGGGVREAMLPDCEAKPLAPEPTPRAMTKAGQGEACGGLLGLQCDTGLWCDPEPGLCGAVDVLGVCVVEGPEVCFDLNEPVCGCDSVTYDNDCKRQQAKEPKAYDGACFQPW